jgi:proteasome lid subunit RPN8/RPN11
MVLIDKGWVKKIREHSQAESPKEACGVLAGTRAENSVVKRVVPCTNADINSSSAYTIHPTELLKVLDEIEFTEDIELVGFYHSHPFSSAHPSLIDEGRATWDDFLYMIFSVAENRLTAWTWDEEKNNFIEEKVVIT